MGSQELKNNVHEAAAVLKGPELQRCYFLNQVQLLSTSLQVEFLGKKKGLRVELMPGGLLYGSKLIC